MGKADIVFGLIFGALSILFYIGTLSFPKINIGINPKTYPLIIIFCTFAFSITLVIQGIKKLRREKGPSEKSLPHGKTALKLIILAIGMFIYVLGFEPLGYIIVTPLLMALTMLLFGERKVLRIIVVSVIVSIVLYWLFRTVFRVPLPRSFLW
mgnify:CR=1 FL=1|jgi:putative tricarboxylic transport membrane protein